MTHMYLSSSSQKEKIDEIYKVGETIGFGATSVVHVVQHKVSRNTLIYHLDRFSISGHK